MRNIFRILSLLLLFSVALPDTSAQVSVRRSGSRSESSSPRRDKKDKKDKERDPKTATESPANAPQALNRNTPPARPAQANQPAAEASGVRRNTTATRRAAEQPTTVDGNSVRLQAFNEYQRKDQSAKPWQHVVYRELDLKLEKNASLYYPTEPQDGLTNLFRVILEGLCTGKLKGYEYLDGREIFEQKYEIKVGEILDKFQILYQERPAVGQNGRPTYIVDEMDVPSNEVLSYFVKERWEFNQKTSSYGPTILALCPVLHRAGDFGGDDVHYPMFWINYEDLRPLLRTQLIMSDGMNNAPRFTMEEFFTLQQYQGDIYKVQNVRGLSLAQQYPNPDTLKIARAKIEAQLRGFGDSIWVHEPTAEEIETANAEKAAARKTRRETTGKADRNSDRADGKVKRNRRTKEEVDTSATEALEQAQEEELDRRIEQTGRAHSARRSRR